MAFLFTGFDGDSALVLKSKESFCLQVGDWQELKIAFQCSLLPTGSFSSISGSNGSSITGSIQNANSNRDFIYFGVKENNFSFPQSGFSKSGVSPSFYGHYIGYTNKSTIEVESSSLTFYDNPDTYFSPSLLYQSANHSGISLSPESIYIHNNGTENVATNVLSFVIGNNESESNQVIDCSYSSNTNNGILNSGEMLGLLNSVVFNNQSVNWNKSNGVLPNQMFIYNGMNNLYLRIHSASLQKTTKQYSTTSIINSGAFISFDNAVNSVLMELPHELNQCQFFIGNDISGVNSYTNNNISFGFKSFWSGSYFDFSDMSINTYSGILNTKDMLWYRNHNVNLITT